MVGSNVFSTGMYIVMGLIGAWAYPHHCPANVLTRLSAKGVDPTSASRIVTRITAMAWSFFMIGCGVPVYSIMVRYNLMVSGLCAPKWAQFWGVAFPWVISWLFYIGSAFTAFINWNSLLIFGLINFSMPLAAHIASLPARSEVQKKGEVEMKHSSDPNTVDADAQAQPLSSEQKQPAEELKDYGSTHDGTSSEPVGEDPLLSNGSGVYRAFPEWMWPYQRQFVWFSFVLSVVIQIVAIVLAIK